MEFYHWHMHTKKDSWWTGSEGVLNRFKTAKTVFEPVHVAAKDRVPWA